ncbi:DUF418 domain-containing protein [Robertkochia sediminum]|uniref:DUF418 domain-containing protein n=1 Tax=Robertkochia sediminum TaxID=2785326 RepID=UPI001931D31A|nr:DUF418 domain-containing protein [Robertkochia sediminum]MBL7472108.1 DUF418 domain-containing protein [Robertkochia sediminum]
MLQPTTKQERITAVDALRGFALLGIILANLPWAGDRVVHSDLDETMNFVHLFLIQSKFITIFSILFGFGFYIQFERSLKGGARFNRYFMIRMTLLFLIGCLHGYLIWMGDIIRTYALCGMLLLLVRNWPVKRLLWLAFVFNVVLTAAMFIATGALNLESFYDFEPALWEEHLTATSYERYLWVNYMIDNWRNFIPDMPVTLFFSFGNIALGYALAKMRFFDSGLKHLKKVKRYLVAGGVVLGLPFNYALYLVYSGKLELELSLLWVPFGVCLGIVLLALTYMILFQWAYEVLGVQKVLRLFEPVGRTALTNYIAQSMIYLVFFHHVLSWFQLYGKLSFAETWIAGFLFFAVQMVASKLWLRYFRQGPLEYLWKRVAYSFTKRSVSRSIPSIPVGD